MHVSFDISAIPPPLYRSTSLTLLRKASSSKGNDTDQVTKVPAESLAAAAALLFSASATTLNSDDSFFRCHVQTLFCLGFLCDCTPEVEREEISYYHIHASKYLVRSETGLEHSNPPTTVVCLCVCVCCACELPSISWDV